MSPILKTSKYKENEHGKDNEEENDTTTSNHIIPMTSQVYNLSWYVAQEQNSHRERDQCDQIWRFIGLWTTF